MLSIVSGTGDLRETFGSHIKYFVYIIIFFFNPSRCMFLAAFMSLSCVFPHCGHVHILLSSFNLSLWYWQLLHVLLEGYHWSMCISVRPCSYAFCSIIFVNMCHDFSCMPRDNLLFFSMPLMFSVSMQIT